MTAPDRLYSKGVGICNVLDSPFVMQIFTAELYLPFGTHKFVCWRILPGHVENDFYWSEIKNFKEPLNSSLKSFKSSAEMTPSFHNADIIFKKRERRTS